MNLKELAWPIRIYWDLPGSASGKMDILKVCDEIIEIKTLFLSLRDTAPASHPVSPEILDRFAGRHIAVSLTLPWTALSPPLLNRLTGFPIKTLLAEVSSMEDVRAFAAMTGIHEQGRLRPGISFDVRKDNYGQIPELVVFCLEAGIGDLLFPIQRLVEKGEVFCLTRQMRENLTAQLRNVDYNELRITIHDPFLWQVFYPDAEYHEGGCQAANSMVYISPDYRVYPCPAMPVELGDLHDSNLRDIILSEKKHHTRSLLHNPPDESMSCEQAAQCLGGCRGRAFAVSGSMGRCDPAC